MIIEEVWKYINGEKEFSSIQDLPQKSFDTDSGRNIEFEDYGENDGLHMEKVVTKMNGTIYLYIPKNSNQNHPPDVNKIAHDLNEKSLGAGGGYNGGANCEWGSWSSDSEGSCIKIKDKVR